MTDDGLLFVLNTIKGTLAINVYYVWYCGEGNCAVKETALYACTHGTLYKASAQQLGHQGLHPVQAPGL